MSTRTLRVKQDGVAQYLLIAEVIRSWINSGRHKTGETVGTVEDLAEHFGVAKATIQAALKELSSQGVITTSRGRRSEVRNAPQMRALRSGLHLGEALSLEEGTPVTQDILSVCIVPTDDQTLDAIRLRMPDFLLQVRSLLNLGDRPSVYVLAYFSPTKIGADPLALDESKLLERMREVYNSSQNRQRSISATTADIEVSSIIGIPIGSPLLYYRSKLWSENKELDVYYEQFLRSDGCEYILGQEIRPL